MSTLVPTPPAPGRYALVSVDLPPFWWTDDRPPADVARAWLVHVLHAERNNWRCRHVTTGVEIVLPGAVLDVDGVDAHIDAIVAVTHDG